MIYNDRVAFKVIEEFDLQFLIELRNNPSTWRNLGTLNFINIFNQRGWLEKVNTDSSKEYFIIWDNSRYTRRLGMVRMDEIDPWNRSIRVGADIHPKYRGQGLGTATFELIFEYCFNQRNMNRVYLTVLDYNTIAYNLYTKIGFKEEGRQRQAIYRNGKYHDYIMMSILKEEYDK